MGKECRTVLGVNGKGVQDCVGCEWKRSADVGAGSVNVIYNTTQPYCQVSIQLY